MSTLIKNGTVVTAVDTYRADVLIEGETIAAVGTGLAADGAKVIDATDRYVIPGGIDIHTHLDMPFGGSQSSDDFYTGTVAAACGGTTSLVDFAIPEPGGTLQGGFDTWMGKAEGKAVIDYGFHMILREYTPALGDEIAAMVERGVTSFKLFTAYPGVFLMDDGAIFQTMQRAAEVGGLICVHAENGRMIDTLVAQALARGETAPQYHALTRPPRAEAEATARVIALAEVAGARVYIVHLTCAEALDEVKRARARGAQVFAETCPQYLFLSYQNYLEPDFGGAKYVMSPPLRDPARQNELWQGLAADDLQVVSTDHCPFPMKDKRMGEGNFTKIPNGAPGIETRMSLMFDGGVREGRLSLNRWIEVTSTAPAKMFGLYPKKGTIAPGADADLVVFDPEAKTTLSAKTLHQNVDYCPYEGRVVHGVSETVLSRGRVIVEKGSFTGTPGAGQYLRRDPR